MNGILPVKSYICEVECVKQEVASMKWKVESTQQNNIDFQVDIEKLKIYSQPRRRKWSTNKNSKRKTRKEQQEKKKF